MRRSIAAACGVLLVTAYGAQPLTLVAAAQDTSNPDYHVTALVDGLTVQQVGTYIGGHNVMEFYGEISNQSQRPLAGIGLLIEMYNDRDERLARGGTQEFSSNVLQPGSKAVWQADVSDTPKSWARIEITVGVTSLASLVANRDYTDVV